MNQENGVVAFIDRGVPKLKMWSCNGKSCKGKIVPAIRINHD